MSDPATPTLTLILDGRPVAAQPGQTVLDAARAAGCEIPTLCHQPGIEPRTSCFLCAVRVEGMESLQPACTLPVRDRMVVVTDSDEIRSARKTALELLFSDHAGRCEAPCSIGCPAHLAVPEMMEALARGDAETAARVARRDLVFPATLAALCPAFCEGPCLRKQFDRSVEIRRLHGTAAWAGEALPACARSTGKRVAVIGADPVTLAAAWFLQLAGHACTVHGSREAAAAYVVPASAGQAFVVPASAGKGHEAPPATRSEPARAVSPAGEGFPAKAGTTNLSAPLPAEAGTTNVLSAQVFACEVSAIERLGVVFAEGNPAAGSADAVVLACDAALPDWAAPLHLVVRAEYRLTDPAALVRAVAAGRALAQQVAQAFQPARPAASPHAAAGTQGSPIGAARQAGKPAPPPRPFYFAARGETEAERRLVLSASGVPPLAEGERILPPETRRGEPLTQLAVVSPQSTAYSLQPTVSKEADRCLRCGCAKRDDCRLRHYGALYGARPQRFQGARRELEPETTHTEIVYEPGKCILCGLCLKIAEAAGEAPGLAFVGRGFPTRVAVPFGDGLAGALRQSARACAEACPTAALSLRKG